MAEDIYPLGQGNGLLTDILNFLGNNVYQFGQSAGDSSQRTNDLMMGLKAGKSDPNLLSQLVRESIANNPTTGGVLGPIRTAEQKAIISKLFKAAPDLLERIKQSPVRTDVQVGKIKGLEDAGGVLSRKGTDSMVERLFDTLLRRDPQVKSQMLTVHPDVMRGRIPAEAVGNAPQWAGVTGKQSMHANTPAVIAHEGQHAVNTNVLDRLPSTTVGDNLTTAMIGPGGLMQKPGYRQVMNTLEDQGSYAGLDEAIAYLRQNQVFNKGKGDNNLNGLLQELNQAARPSNAMASSAAPATPFGRLADESGSSAEQLLRLLSGIGEY